MATQKPISTISYNSESFLKEKLDIWFNAHIIQAYQYIVHKGEEGDKNHIHLRIEPNKKLDPMCLQEELREFDPVSEKPLCCRPFRPSKEEDWFLYVVHDKTYLRLKYGGGEKGEKLPYSWQQIIVSDFYDCEIAFIRAQAYLSHTSVNMATRIQKGESPLNLILEGENVHTVNAISHALYSNDYARLSEDYRYLSEQFDLVMKAISKKGFSVVKDSDGNLYLE